MQGSVQGPPSPPWSLSKGAHKSANPKPNVCLAAPYNKLNFAFSKGDHGAGSPSPTLRTLPSASRTISGSTAAIRTKISMFASPRIVNNSRNRSDGRADQALADSREFQPSKIAREGRRAPRFAMGPKGTEQIRYESPKEAPPESSLCLEPIMATACGAIKATWHP